MTRFHLSTLLLMCIFAGAVVGVALHHDVWQLEFEFPWSDVIDENRYDAPMFLSVNGDGTQIAALSYYTLNLLDLRTQKKLWGKRVDLYRPKVEQIRFSIDGKSILISSSDNISDLRFNAADGEVIKNTTTLQQECSSGAQPWQKVNRFISYAPNRDEKISTEQMSSFSPMEAMAIESDNQFTFSNTSAAICSTYFRDGNRVVIGGIYELSIWRRMRNYGWIGFLELPLTWVALLSFACLSVIFVRWVRGRIRNREVRNV